MIREYSLCRNGFNFIYWGMIPPKTGTPRPATPKTRRTTIAPPSTFKLRGIDNFDDFVRLCKRNYANQGNERKEKSTTIYVFYVFS